MRLLFGMEMTIGGNVTNATISEPLHIFDMVFGHFTSLPPTSTTQWSNDTGQRSNDMLYPNYLY